MLLCFIHGLVPRKSPMTCATQLAKCSIGCSMLFHACCKQWKARNKSKISEYSMLCPSCWNSYFFCVWGISYHKICLRWIFFQFSVNNWEVARAYRFMQLPVMFLYLTSWNMWFPWNTSYWNQRIHNRKYCANMNVKFRLTASSLAPSVSL